MITSDYSTKNEELKYQWSIKEFSSHFTGPEIDEMWTQKVKFGSDSHQHILAIFADSVKVEWYLNVHSLLTGFKVIFELSIMNENDQPLRTVKRDIVNCQMYKLMEIKKAEFESAELLHNDTLTMKWRMMVIDKLNPKVVMAPYSPTSHGSLGNDLKQFLKNDNHHDVIFLFDNQELKAHKIILMARSAVFSAMFTIDMVEKSTNRVKIDDISFSIFELLFNYIYTDRIEIKLDINSGMNLLYAASKYQLEDLETLCEQQICEQLTPTNLANVLLMAQQKHKDNLVKAIKQYTADYFYLISMK